jgi:light-regulated signal transduction histidine kinase (bacteriophytochrome)
MQDLAPEFSAEGKRYLALIRDNATAMTHLIEDLLCFSRTTRQLIHQEPVVMVDLVHQVLDNLQAVQTGRQIDIQISSLPDAQADAQLLRQVWVNLLSNAFKFTRPRDVARIEIGHKMEDGTGAYYVKDNGVGFAMENADRLFGVFQRLHGEEEFEGTGVGLAIVERIVRRHGGRVWAEAEVDGGATFFFTLEN